MLRTERDKIAHLLRRFALGASETELDYYAEGGLNGAIEKLLANDQVHEKIDVPILRMKPEQARAIPMPTVGAHWTLRLLTTRRPLVEKMTVFWHDHFATSAQKVAAGPIMHAQIEILRQNALGSFPTLLERVSKDPAMVFWLDGQFNVRGRANENFAREVMELFTLGIGHYTEKDIQEAARAFTGWTLRRRAPSDFDPRVSEFVFNRRAHDETEKTILGQTANFDGDGVLKLLCDQPRTALYLAEKLWAWFAYPDPEPKVVERVAAKFRASGLDIKVALREIMTAPEFYSDKAFRKVYKNPVDFVIPPLRQLGIGELLIQRIEDAPAEGELPPALRAPIAIANQAMQAMGMQLLYPPDVAGWEGGPTWISSATMVERMQFGNRLFSRAPQGSRKAHLNFPPTFLREDPTPLGVAKKLASVFDANLTSAQLERVAAAVRDATDGLPMTPQTAQAAAAAGTRLIFGTPEYQFA